MQLHGFNEISGRYVELPDDTFFQPNVWRQQSAVNKQGSAGDLPPDVQALANEEYGLVHQRMFQGYQKLLQWGVAREQARFLLPLSFYTKFVWTCSLQAVLHFIDLRDHAHAQSELRDYARVFKRIVEEQFPEVARVYFRAASSGAEPV